MLIMILISDGPTCGTLAAAMTTTNIKLRRRLRLTRGRLVGRMSQERQKLSFFLVLMFLVIFGLIVLAEVLFMEDHKSDIFYEDNTDENQSEVNELEVDETQQVGDNISETMDQISEEASEDNLDNSSDEDKV